VHTHTLLSNFPTLSLCYPKAGAMPGLWKSPPLPYQGYLVVGGCRRATI